MSSLEDLAENFDEWRDRYDDLSFAEQKVVYERIRELYPNQRSFTVNQAYPFFAEYRPASVVELGGWDGFLAACVLGQNTDIRSWVNYDLTDVLQSCVDPRYRMVVLDEPVWAKPSRLQAHAFVATHTIEHIKMYELGKLLAALDVECCLIEAPIAAGPTDWTGHPSTHVLEVGWDSVDGGFRRQGFRVDHEWQHGRWYVR